MLVLYRNGGLGYFTAHITAAMYGTTVIEMAVPRDRSVRPYIVGEWFGPGKWMTPDHNTSISAVGVVFRGGPNWDFDLLVYHNAHAAGYCQVEQNPPVLRKDSAGSETENQ